jgi:glutathione S-transferase
MSTPSMTLFHNPASPFVRKVLVLLHETGQQDRVALQLSQLTPVKPDRALIDDNPLSKIPALRLANGTVIHDSRVILDYLDHQHVGNPLIPRDGAARWRRLTLASLADGIMDAAVMIRYETALRPVEKHWDEWLDAQRDKIRRALGLLEAEAIAELASHFDVASISVACAGLPGPAPSRPGMAQGQPAISSLVCRGELAAFDGRDGAQDLVLYWLHRPLREQARSHNDCARLVGAGLLANGPIRFQRKQPSNQRHQLFSLPLILPQPQRPAHFTSPNSKLIAAAGFAPTPYQSSLRVSTMNTPNRLNNNSEPINSA